ncbi:Zinc finger CCHC-type [Arabidopsis thaliana x Arabidopsis arenosa]|uniref:Zinc finger CCHC-type n=1 Tax=Arabidopsis thaliana x Arabidopsis arenosa TaxID=1240361 RepID=A0A8T1Z4E5_9BRAS|nr:Zinc finger CCHC-type [Arabidopsis thaliana x Arabidopsis arenosa]
MANVSVREMTSKFGKLDKFEGVDFRRWQKKMHFLLTTLNVVHVLSVPMPTVSENGENESVEETRKQLKWENDDYICRGHILNGMSDSLFDVYQNVESAKELWDALESKYMAEDASSKKFLVSDFNNYKMSDSRPVMEQYNELLRILGQFAQHNMNMDESISVSCIIDKLPPSWKDFRRMLKHKKEELSLVQLGSHLRIEESLRVQEGGKPKDKEAETSSINMMEESGSSKMKNKGKKRPFTNNTNDGSNKRFKSVCWICNKPGHFKRDCRAAKDKNKTQQKRFGQGSKDQGPSSHQGQNSVFDLHSKVYYVSKIAEAFYVQDDEVAWWIDSGATIHVCKDRGWFKTYEPVQDGSVLYMGNESTAPILGRGKVVLEFSSGNTLDLDEVYKTEVELQHSDLVKKLRTDRGGEYYDPMYFQSMGIIHETTVPYTPQQNGVSERKNRVLKEMVNSMLSYSGLSDGFWGEAMVTACYLLNRVPNKRNKVTPYELWYKKKPNLNYLRVWGCRAIVRLPQPKIKTLGERGIDCIFIGYALHSKAYRFYVIEPNDSIAVHTVIESRDAIFDENRFSSIPRPKDLVPSSSGTKEGEDMFVPPNESPTLRKSKRGRIEKSFGPDFQLYLVEGSRDEIGFQYSYCYHIDDEPRTFSEAMTSNDVIFWKEAVNDEMDSIMGSFRQKEGIDYFDTYAPVVRISSIRLLIGLASIHNLVIHQMDVKTAFLNGVLEEEVYMKQPEGFVMPGNEHKVCKLVKSLYGLKQAPKQWHQRFDEAVLSNGFELNQSDKCLYSKFDDSGNGVIICLYVDDMLIFGTNLRQVELTKEFLSSNFAMEDMGEAEVILGIRIKRENKGISLTQSHYIEKVLKKFNYENCSPVSTPMDASVKLMPNTGQAVSQLEYSRVIGCLMYAMTSTRPDIAYAVGKLSRYTSNPSTHHWQAVRRVLKYLKGTINYGLSYFGFPSVLEGYSDASWNTNEENYSSTSGWVFLLGGGAISWASKKQTCITNSTMESEFVALAAAGREAEWLRHLVSEIPLWPKPVSPISIHCDSQATLAKAYSQVYNGKSRHLGLRHSGIRELITHGVITLEFIRSEHNLADHLTKGLARDLVIKSAKGMGLKSI